MSSKPLALFWQLYLGLVETAALYEILNGRYQDSFVVIEGSVHELQMFLHKSLKDFRGRQRTGVLVSADHGQHWDRPCYIKRGVMRLRTFFSRSDTPETPYGQAVQTIMLVNLH